MTYRVIGIKLGIDESAARRRVQTAISKGYLQNKETKPSCAAKIVLGEPLPDAKEVLPHPNAQNGGPTESTTDQPTNDNSLVKPNSYGRQPKEPTDCQQPTDAPQDSRTVETEGGQAGGREWVNKYADHNCMKNHRISSRSRLIGMNNRQKQKKIFSDVEKVSEKKRPWNLVRPIWFNAEIASTFHQPWTPRVGGAVASFMQVHGTENRPNFPVTCIPVSLSMSRILSRSWRHGMRQYLIKWGRVEALKLGNNPDLMEVLV